MFKCICTTALCGFIAGTVSTAAVIVQGETNEPAQQILIGAAIGTGAGLLLGMLGYAVKYFLTHPDDIELDSSDADSIGRFKLRDILVDESADDSSDEIDGTLLVVSSDQLAHINTAAFYAHQQSVEGRDRVYLAVECDAEYEGLSNDF